VEEINEGKNNQTLFININEGLKDGIKKDSIDGKDCLIIPIDENMKIKVNGKEI